MKKRNVKTLFFVKILITVILTLIILILIKASNIFKTKFYDTIYNNNISFSSLNKVYNKYIGKSDILDSFVKTETVFNEKLIYKKTDKYKEGVKLSVSSNYLVPVEESGVVVFIGEKEGYGNTIIIQRIDGVDEWYGNISNTSIKLYDYVKKGTLLGEANSELYLVYKKDGQQLDYEKYIK